MLPLNPVILTKVPGFANFTRTSSGLNSISKFCSSGVRIFFTYTCKE